MTADRDLEFMGRALELARRAEGRTSPNPPVGAVLVRGGRVVGEGFHRRAGEAHAEVEALRAAGEAARGAILYVTLEPCGHQGRTPPCVDSLLAAGVAEVVYAVGDPNPLVDGSGHRRLAAGGVKVRTGVAGEEAAELCRPFFKYVRTGRPLVTAKFAMSLDGKIATRTGDSRWISSPGSRRRAHELRNVSDAIVVGAGTVLADDPRLTTRLDGAESGQALRLVVDSRGRVPPGAQVFSPELPGRAVLATTAATGARRRALLEEQGVEVWTLPAAAAGRVSLAALLDRIGSREMLSVLVEGGGELLGSFFAAGLVDRVVAVVAPLIIGGRRAPGPVGGEGAAELRDALRLRGTKSEELDGDLWIRAGVGERPGAGGRQEAALAAGAPLQE